MTNVLIIHLGLGPCVIETIRLYHTLQERGELNMRSIYAENISRNDVSWCDMAIFIRSVSSIELHLMKLFQKYGKYVILVMDDDLLSLDENYGKDGEGFWKIRKKFLKDILHNIDCLIAVNEKLLSKYVQIGHIPKSFLLNTMVEDNEFFSDRQLGVNRETVKLALYTNDGTTTVFDDIIRPVLPKLALRYPHKLELYLMALRPDLNEMGNEIKIIYVPHMPYKDFKRYMGTESFDIGLAPLLDIGFSIFKYYNKYIEYTLAGIPSIYSDCALYRKIINDGENGVLCSNTVDGWYRAICDLIDFPSLRKQLIINAQKHLRDNFSCESIIAHLKTELPQLCEYKAQNARITNLFFRLLYIKMYYKIFRFSGWCYIVKVYIKKGKFRALYKRFYYHFIFKQ